MTGIDMSGRLILNDAATPSSFVALSMLWGSSMSWPVEMENRRYAGGALRPVTAARPVPRWTPNIARVTAAQALALTTRTGVTHIARDTIGQRIACVWETVGVQWLGPAGGSAVSALVTLELERTDWDEAV